jgi:hypothetical protein
MASTCTWYHPMGYMYRSQANFMSFESWLVCFIMVYRVNMEQTTHKQPTFFTVVCRVVYSFLPILGKVTNTIGTT